MWEKPLNKDKKTHKMVNTPVISNKDTMSLTKPNHRAYQYNFS